MQTSTSARADGVATQVLTVALVDDQALFRAGLKYILAHSSIHVVGACNSIHGRALLAETSVDLAIVDINLSDRRGLDVLEALRGSGNMTPILVVSGQTDEFSVMAALAAGANGFLPKSAEPSELLTAIATVAGGGLYLHRLVTASGRPGRATTRELSARESHILELLVQGCTNEEMAECLHLSVSSVKGALRKLFANFGVTDRTCLAAEATRAGLIKRPHSPSLAGGSVSRPSAVPPFPHRSARLGLL